MAIVKKCPRCDSDLGDGLDLRKQSCHNCGFNDGSPEPPAPEPTMADRKRVKE